MSSPLGDAAPTACSGDAVSNSENGRDHPIHRTCGDLRSSERDEFAEDARGAGARCEHEAVKRRRIIVEVAGYLDPVPILSQRPDDVAVKLLRVSRYEEVVDFRPSQG